MTKQTYFILDRLYLSACVVFLTVMSFRIIVGDLIPAHRNQVRSDRVHEYLESNNFVKHDPSLSLDENRLKVANESYQRRYYKKGIPDNADENIIVDNLCFSENGEPGDKNGCFLAHQLTYSGVRGIIYYYLFLFLPVCIGLLYLVRKWVIWIAVGRLGKAS